MKIVFGIASRRFKVLEYTNIDMGICFTSAQYVFIVAL